MRHRKRFVNISVLLILLLVVTALSSVLAKVNNGGYVYAIVTEEKAYLYSATNEESKTQKFYVKDAKIKAFRNENEAWLSVFVNDESGTETRYYLSVFDLAIEYRGLSDGTPVGESKEVKSAPDIDMYSFPPYPPETVDYGGYGIDGIVMTFKVTDGFAYVQEEQRLTSKTILKIPEGALFQGVYIDDSNWVSVLVEVDGEKKIGYVLINKDGSGEKLSIATINIKSGIISVYEKPSKSSKKVGFVDGPTKIRGEWVDGKNWVKVEVETENGYIEGYIYNARTETKK